VVGKRTDNEEILFEICGKTPDELQDKIRGKLW
jgi:hypothetical protein